ncbi:MAG TPA: ATP-dependent DNA ligase [Tepidisphaeraceae bacterium]|nr:ATP-dependent DNA ligase [Tepidisphaeraceae bacterium]
MPLPIKPPFAPMEAELVDAIPTGAWQYEPKWDGFRCLAFRDGAKIELQSKSGQPLGRYFSEVVAALSALKSKQFVLDGEIVVPVDGQLSFDQLLQRIHPAASRIKKLSTEFPAIYVVFDLLVDERGKSLVQRPLSERRARLESFAARFVSTGNSAAEVTEPRARIHLSPATSDIKQAGKWFSSTNRDLDGVIAKRADADYRSGDRTGMVKVKNMRTAECVVGGFRYGSKATKTLGSLLLGLYDDEGLLHHVGFCSALTEKERVALTPKIEKLKKSAAKGGGFTGKAPGGPSRWSTERTGEWEPLDPKLVVEVRYDHFSAGRFRHGTKFLRWRPDKAPRACTMEQVKTAGPPLALLEGPAPKRRKAS